MVDLDVIRTRIEHAEEALRRLAVIRARGRGAFLAEWENRDIAERNLQTLIQAVIDAGNHIVTDAGLGAPVRYADILEKMARAGVIADDSAGTPSSGAATRDARQGTSTEQLTDA
ncbi:MAG: HepT-like ribonuclease domain-containing protein [Polyangia bacterium]